MSRRPSSVRAGTFRRVELLGRGGRWRPPQPSEAPARLIAVGAAEQGAGKSTVATNLAIALADLGAHVVLVDMDLSSPGLHRLLGIERPVPGLQALLDRQIGSLDVSLTRTEIRNLHLVAGGDEASRALVLDREQKRGLMRQIRELGSDVIVCDVGAANGNDLLDFFSLGALRLMVTAPQPAALERAYAFLKGAAVRAVRHFGGAADEALRCFGGKLIGNQTHNDDEVEVFHAFSRLVADYLRIPLPVLGCLRADDRMARHKRPLLARPGIDDNVRAFHRMAEALMREDVTAATACDLGGATEVSVAQGPLPVGLDGYRRRHPRHEVDWIATLKLGERQTAVRVVDVSLSGAALEVPGPLEIGQQATLVFDQLPGRPTIPVAVRSLRETVRRAGVAFATSGADDLPRILVAAAQSGRSPLDHCPAPGATTARRA